MAFYTALQCRECEAIYDITPVSHCPQCFGPLEVVYDYEKAAAHLTREALSERPFTMWRYRELLPISGEPGVGFYTGGTPLLKADKLAEALGMSNLYIKNDAVNFPTLSFKDRVVSVAISAALQFGFDTVGCASTGNLANSVAAQAAMVGLPAVILIPYDLETAKIQATACYGPRLIPVMGNYDEVNRLCSEIAYEKNWGFVNINLRAFYAEGSKTMAFEIAEQLGWTIPDAVVVPMAGGSLINKIRKGFEELINIHLCEPRACKFYGAQPTGCNPITAAVKQRSTEIQPVRPDTIAKSLAIGNPADGYHAAKTILQSGGWGEDVTDEEILHGIELLARTEGIFTETAGGVTVAVTRKLIDGGYLAPDDLTVICITGNGLKTQEALEPTPVQSTAIDANLEAFEEYWERQHFTRVA